MKIQIIPTKNQAFIKKHKRKWILPLFFCLILFFGVGYFVLSGDFLTGKLGDIQDIKYNSYVEELTYKGNNPEPVFTSGGNLNITVNPEVAVIFQTSNGLSYGRHDIKVCNTQTLSITPLDNSFGLRFNQELQDLKINEIINEPVFSYHVYDWQPKIIGSYPNSSNMVVYEDKGYDVYENKDVLHDITPEITQTTLLQQQVYYIPTSINASGCKDYVLEYKPNENDETLKWDVYLWQGNMLSPSSSLLLDPNWVLSSSEFQISLGNFTGSMGDDGANLSLSNITYYNYTSGYAESVKYCPNEQKNNWSLVTWNVAEPNYGISQIDTTGMRYYLQMNETGTEPLIENITNIGWNVSSPAETASHNTTGCIIGNCIVMWDSTNRDRWDRVVADDNAVENVDLSLEAWVKSNGIGCTSANGDCAIWGYQTTDDTKTFWIGGTGGSGLTRVYASDTTTTLDVSGSVIIMDGNWHHVYVQIGSLGVKMYVDGNLDATDPDTSVIASATYNSNKIGNHKSTNARGWKGNIDEFVLRTGANAYLTQTQINQHYKQGIGKYDIAVRFGSSNETIITMPYNNISGNGSLSKTELNSSIECMQYRYYGYSNGNGTNANAYDPYLEYINFSYLSVDVSSAPSGIINVTNYKIYTTLGTNLTNENLLTSFIPITNNTDTNMHGNVSFIKDYDNSTIDTNSLGYGLIFGWHSSNTTDYINQKLTLTENGGVVAGGSQGYLGKGTEFDGVNDWINVTNSEISLNITDVTVCAWINPNLNKSGTVVIKGYTSSYILATYWMYFGAGSLPTNNIIRTIWGDGTNYVYYNSYGIVPINVWSHICIQKGNIYIDGSNSTGIKYGTGIEPSSNNIAVSIGSTGNSGSPFNGSIDEVYIWKRALNSSDVLRLYNEQVGSKINDVVLTNNSESTSTLNSGNTTKGNVWRNEVCIGNPETNTCFGSNSLTILNSAPTTPTQISPINNLITGNYTANMTCNGSTDVDGDSINYEFYFDASNPPTTLVQNTTLTKYGTFLTTDGNWYWRCRANDGSAVSSYTSARKITIDRRNIVNTNDYYKSSVTEGETAYFESNITINQHRVNRIPNALLTYNNTNYSASIAVINSSYYKASVSLTVPQVTNTPTTKTFFWLYDNELLNGSVEINRSVSNNQLIYKIQLFNCTDASVNATQVMVFNYTFQDEQEGTNLSVDFDASYIVWNGDKSINSVFSVEFTNTTNVGICYTPKNQTYVTEANLKYVQNTYDTRWYYYQEYPTTNTTHNRILYLLGQFKGGITLAENIGFTVLDNVGNPLPNYLIYVDKYWEGTNTYSTVAMGKTDGFGKSYIYLDKLTTVYRIRVEHNNINDYTGSQGIIGTTSYPEIRIGVTTQADILSIIDGVGTSLTYNNDTKTITAVYNYSGSQIVDVTLDVYERRNENDTWICSETAYNVQSGVINCYYGNNTGGRYIATLSVGSQGSLMATNSLEIDLTSTLIKDLMGGDGLWITALMVLTLFFVGLWKPEVSIILGVLGLFLAWTIGFIYLSWGVVIALIIMVIFLIVRGSR